MGCTDELLRDTCQALAQGNLSIAADALAQALLFDPTHPEVWYQTGLVLYQTGYTVQALAAIEHAINLEKRGVYLLTLAQIYRAEGHLTRAEKLLELAIDDDRTLVEAWLQLGCVYGDQGRFTEALACLVRAKQPGFAGAALTEIGKIHEASGRVAEAIEAYEQALAINPDSVLALEGLSRLSVTGKYTLNRRQIARIGRLSATFAGCPSHAQRSVELALAEELSFTGT